MRRAGDRLNTDTSAGRRDDTSLQGTVTTTTAARAAGEDVAMRAVLPRLIDITVFNLAFLMTIEAPATPQRCVLTRKCQNKCHASGRAKAPLRFHTAHRFHADDSIHPAGRLNRFPTTL
ncbi:hypothetical protein BDFG_07198 [Blastomyces dermatitidis ATCC 26199]|nr:hypothetical protein BDFG_07198 [Blastomyces dermatitidis ATCC 26199]